MILDDIREQIVERSQQLWGQLQENQTVVGLKERYQALTPTGQKLSLLGGVAAVMIAILLVPYVYYSSASDALTDFETKKNLIRGLFLLQKQTAELPPLPLSVTSSELVSQARRKVESTRVQAEQIKSIVPYDRKVTGGVASDIIQSGVEIALAKLNLTQVREIGTELLHLPNVKMVALSVDADSADPHYFNVNYKLVNFSVPVEATPPPKPGAKKK